jgi:hypothetical protein
MIYTHGNGRIQGRAGNGRFRRFTGEEFGIGVCPKCQTLTTRPELPAVGPIDPVDFNARVCVCGWDSRKAKV